jgi:amino acid transporter
MGGCSGGDGTLCITAFPSKSQGKRRKHGKQVGQEVRSCNCRRNGCGIVIGSGVFFKAEKILKATGGNLPLGILAWIIGGAIMVVCAYTFSIMATRYEYVNGVVDYAEVAMGKKYGYYVAWFMATIYYPTLTSVLAWVSARTPAYCSILVTGPRQ